MYIPKAKQPELFWEASFGNAKTSQKKIKNLKKAVDFLGEVC